MSFFTAATLRPMSQEQIARKAPAVFAQGPSSKTSSRYLFVSTEKLIESLNKKDWHVVAASQTLNRASSLDAKLTNQHALFLAHGNQLNNQFNAGDTMPLLKIENSHNGLSSFNMMTGFFRKACANGLTVPESIFAAPKVRHTINMANDVVEAAYTVLRDFPRLTEMQRELSQLTLNDEEKLLLLDSATEIFFDKEQIEANRRLALTTRQPRAEIDFQLGMPQRFADRKNDLWTVSNVIQENLIRGNVRLYNPETNTIRSTRKVTSIDRDSDIHDKLFRLTQKFAELKGLRIGAVA